MYTKIEKVMTLDDYKDKSVGISDLGAMAASGITIAKGIADRKGAYNKWNRIASTTKYAPNIDDKIYHNDRLKANLEMAGGAMGAAASALSVASRLRKRAKAKKSRSYRLSRMIQSGEIDIADALNYYYHEKNKKFKGIMKKALIMVSVDPDSGADRSSIIGEFRKNRRG